MDDEGRNFVLSSLKKISEYPKKINDNGAHLANNTRYFPGTDFLLGNYEFILNDVGLDYSLRMRTEVRSLLEYLFDLKEDPSYLNEKLTPIMNDLNFLTKDTGVRQQLKSLRSRYGIRKKKNDVAMTSLPSKTIFFVDEISKRYRLSDEMNDWKEQMERAKKTKAEKKDPVLTASAAIIEPKTAYRDHVKDFMIDLMDLGSERDYFMGSDIIEVFHSHYSGFMESGADDDLKKAVKRLREDVHFAGRDYRFVKGDITDMKMHEIIDRLKAYAR